MIYVTSSGAKRMGYLVGTPTPDGLLAGVLLGGLVTTWGFAMDLRFFRCPRCGEWFFVGPARLLIFHKVNLFTQNCLHCDLEKWK